MSENTNETEIENKAEKKSKKNFSFENQIKAFNQGGGALLFVILSTFLVVIIACLAVFFLSVRGAEKVRVPNVVGKPLTTALLEMQDKELYPALNLRYSDVPGEAGLVLEQSPKGGAIVKAYRRINLTVSRGVPTNVVGQYLGQNVDQVKSALELEFSGESEFVKVAPPALQAATTPMGTIIAQYPKADTPFTEPVTLYFVVSTGNSDALATVPNLNGTSVEKILKEIDTYNLIFDFTGHEATDKNTAGTITSVSSEAGEKAVPVYSHVKVDVALNIGGEEGAINTGIYTAYVDEYPYPVPMRLESTDIDGKTTVLANFRHTGGTVTLPYEIVGEATLSLYIMDELKDKAYIY